MIYVTYNMYDVLLMTYRYLGMKLPNGDASIRKRKDDITVEAIPVQK